MILENSDLVRDERPSCAHLRRRGLFAIRSALSDAPQRDDRQVAATGEELDVEFQHRAGTAAR